MTASEGSERVGFVGKTSDLGETSEVADQNPLGARHCRYGVSRSSLVPRVEHDSVPLFDQKLGGVASKSVRRPRDEGLLPCQQLHAGVIVAPRYART